MRERLIPISLLPAGAFVLALTVVAAALLAAGPARGALERPTYAAGDRWTYILRSSLATLPGLNASRGSVELGLSGLVEVDVVGPAQAIVGGAVVPGVQAATHASGFLNGTFAIPGNGTVHASGTFSSDTSEIWEGQDGLPTLSNSTSTYVITVTVGIPISVRASVWLNATTSYASVPPFDLGVGETASAPFTTNLSVATTASFFTFSTHNETTGSVAGDWTRNVLSQENVTVEAGTFSAYRLNESLGTFPSLGFGVPVAGANETAWFSNDVGSYVKRQAYVNGTPVAEMRLKSYTYPAAAQGLSLGDLAALVAVPVVVVAVLILLILRRRKKGRAKEPTTGTAGPVGNLPPKPPGGGP